MNIVIVASSLTIAVGAILESLKASKGFMKLRNKIDNLCRRNAGKLWYELVCFALTLLIIWALFIVFLYEFTK